ncbi:hypothetical protein CLV96_0784 [Leptospira meyeri]|uniref:VOC domain-containing protein n=1 Tax=Leptospira meyeri TaxID=29508 RepID=A0A4R8MR58_LEPME|nr:VOC family protein [Leptospira meyeri]TDY71810.1 hypothetical protein CLV96_0784 [Leptospira meyeri]
MKILVNQALVVFLCFGIVYCKNESSSDVSGEVNQKNTKQSAEGKKNMISIVEIPVVNMARAIQFYQSILGVTIEMMTMGDTELGVLPAPEGTVSVVLVKGKEYSPAKNGVLIYFNPGENLQPALDKVEKNGGKILLNKTLISPEMGYYAFFLDSEGNKLGLHSQK